MNAARPKQPAFTPEGITWHGLAKIGQGAAVIALVAYVVWAADRNIHAGLDTLAPPPAVAAAAAADAARVTVPAEAPAAPEQTYDANEYVCVPHPC